VKGWLEDNPVGRALAACAILLVLLILLLGVLWTLPPAASEGDDEVSVEALRLNVPELAESEPLEAFAVISERPLFSENRQPELLAEAGEGDEDELEDQPVDAPEVELAGVVITPTLRMATLRLKDAGESLVAFEGQPLEGNYGSWHVSRVAPREVVLSSGAGEEVQLALQIHDAQIAPPPKPEPRAGSQAAETAAAEAGEEDRPLSRAEEIRRRIEERREELRRAAEEQSGDNAQAQEPEVDYQTAIQSMIGGKRTRNENDDEQ